MFCRGRAQSRDGACASRAATRPTGAPFTVRFPGERIVGTVGRVTRTDWPSAVPETCVTAGHQWPTGAGTVAPRRRRVLVSAPARERARYAGAPGADLPRPFPAKALALVVIHAALHALTLRHFASSALDPFHGARAGPGGSRTPTASSTPGAARSTRTWCCSSGTGTTPAPATRLPALTPWPSWPPTLHADANNPGDHCQPDLDTKTTSRKEASTHVMNPDSRVSCARVASVTSHRQGSPRRRSG